MISQQTQYVAYFGSMLVESRKRSTNFGPTMFNIYCLLGHIYLISSDLVT